MKQIYTQNILHLLLLCACLLYLPGNVFAQCSCAGGVAPNVLSYTATISPTNLPTSNVSFPQFDPAIGTLTCVSLLDTISGVTTTGVRNLASVKVNYAFQLTVSNNISGPGGLGSSQSFSTNYGPDSLDAYGSPRDTITYGPDPLFTNATDSNNTSTVADYYGHGSVSFTYSLSGGLITLQGGLNYRNQIITVYNGGFRLKYFWCPASILANSIREFSAQQLGDNILLQWQGENDDENNSYEIEYSSDGVHFSTLTRLKASSPGASSSSKYRYQYKINPADAGRLYFRLRKQDASGHSGFSAVKTVFLTEPGQAAFRIYPNPSAKHITLETAGRVTGDIGVLLVNSIGQVMFSSKLPVNGAGSVGFDLPSDLRKGLYYLQVSGHNGNDRQMIKLFVREK